MKEPNKPRKTRHVITFEDESDLIVALYGELGWHTKAIARHVGMTACKVQYRLSKAKIKRADYRNGDSPVATQVVNLVGYKIMAHLKKDLPPKFK